MKLSSNELYIFYGTEIIDFLDYEGTSNPLGSNVSLVFLEIYSKIRISIPQLWKTFLTPSRKLLIVSLSIKIDTSKRSFTSGYTKGLAFDKEQEPFLICTIFNFIKVFHYNPLNYVRLGRKDLIATPFLIDDFMKMFEFEDLVYPSPGSRGINQDNLYLLTIELLLKIHYLYYKKN
ncbi:hypothetical protein TNIN_460981 [Trichonephila inaurata madagascariensis]|uniref:Uncharacterized protein n=1 Tax=Trichonephila inaurata madagascariensis TaxID=2747483 RepID=A0A8X6ISU8_9ARAC|nr:hypothetical protein TNIN_460981 [Trichonephila inaurata madagascariensis]